MFDTPLFYAALCGLLPILYLVPASRIQIRTSLVAILSLGILWRLLGMAVSEMVVLLVTGLWTALSAMALARKAAVGSKRNFFPAFMPVLGIWALGKHSAQIGLDTASVFRFVGFSFLVIKSWTLLKDASDGRLKGITLGGVCAYLFYFPTFVSGPMHTYGEFDRSISKPAAPGFKQIVDAVFRLLVGITKLKLVVFLIEPMSLVALVDAPSFTLGQLVKGCFLYSIVIYASFSGYSDAAIATSSLAGIATPENFRSPYLSPTIREFWQRWHITFTRVLTSYLFVPIARWLPKWIGDRRTLLTLLTTIVTFVACGYWHGPTLNFILWGLYHGIGIAFYDLVLRRPVQPLKAGLVLTRAERTLVVARHAGGILTTFTFVSVGWALFVLPIGKLFGS